jgi:alpha-L-rhamnosidase
VTRTVTPEDFPRVQWRGHWIWVPEEPIEASPGWPGETARARGDEVHGFFRKRLRLDRVPECVPARMTADSRYVLYVNAIRLDGSRYRCDE